MYYFEYLLKVVGDSEEYTWLVWVTPTGRLQSDKVTMDPFLKPGEGNLGPKSWTPSVRSPIQH